MSKIDIKSYLDNKYEKLTTKVVKLPNTPHLATILIGDRKDSQVYVKNKEKCIERAGMTSQIYHLEDGTPVGDIMQLIMDLNKDTNVNGILLQLPLNREYYSKKEEDILIGLINTNKDVDGLTIINQGKLFMGDNRDTFLTPCTPTGIVKLLKDEIYNNSLKGLDITIIGRSQLLGNSLAQMLMREDANVTILHSKSGWIMEDYLAMNSVDVLCLCAGQSNLVYASDLDAQQSYTIIDAAINVGADGKLRGDFCKEDYDTLERWPLGEGHTVDYTSVPGGVGPLTTYTLAYNLYKAYCLQNRIEI